MMRRDEEFSGTTTISGDLSKTKRRVEIITRHEKLIEINFDAANLTARDFLNYVSTGLGAKYRPEERDELYLSSLDWPARMIRQKPLPYLKVVEKSGVRVALASIADPDDLQGYPGALLSVIIHPAEDVIAATLETEYDIAIVMSDYTQAGNDAFARQFPELDAILETKTGPPEARKTGDVFIVPAARPHEFQRVLFKL